MGLYQVTGYEIYWDSCKATLVSTSGVENEHRSAGMIEVMKKVVKRTLKEIDFICWKAEKLF